MAAAAVVVADRAVAAAHLAAEAVRPGVAAAHLDVQMARQAVVGVRGGSSCRRTQATPAAAAMRRMSTAVQPQAVVEEVAAQLGEGSWRPAWL